MGLGTTEKKKKQEKTQITVPVSLDFNKVLGTVLYSQSVSLLASSLFLSFLIPCIDFFYLLVYLLLCLNFNDLASKNFNIFLQINKLFPGYFEKPP